jgi:hypothetical protein
MHVHYSLDPLYTADIQHACTLQFRSPIHCRYTTCMYIVRKYIILFVQALETAKKASRKQAFLTQFHNKCKLILYLTTMYVYCIYPAMLKHPKQWSNCLKIA